jgi:hypothetical protein
MRAVTPKVGTKFADTYAPLTAQQATVLVRDYGVGAVLRYENLTAEELSGLLSVPGLLVGLLVTSPKPGYLPTAALATEKHAAAAKHFVSLEVPATATVTIDLETMGGAVADRIAYANAAAQAIVAESLTAGGYIGDGVGMTSAELTELLVTRYLKSESRVTDSANPPNYAEPACGWVGVQQYPGNQRLEDDLFVDFGILGTDYKGRALVLVGQE